MANSKDILEFLSRADLLPPCGVLVTRKDRSLLYYMDSEPSAQWIPCVMMST